MSVREFMIILSLLLLTIYITQLENAYGKHIGGKFAIFGAKVSPGIVENPLNVEIKGVVADVDGDNLFIVPDLNYRNLLIFGNTHVPSSDSKNFPRWKEMQDTMRQKCGIILSPPETHPIIRLEKYGYSYGAIPSTPHEGVPPNVFDLNRPVEECDHVQIRGLYALDHGHSMYHDTACIPSADSGSFDTCTPHAELHPYQVYDPNFVQRVKPLQPGDTNIETHTVVVPYYTRFYDHDWYNKYFGVAGYVVDNSKQLRTNADWFIEAPPPPVEGCHGGCELDVQESVILKQGQASSTVNKESNGARIHVQASADDSVDYKLVTTGLLTNVEDATIYQAHYFVKWVPKQPQDVTITFINATAVDTYDPSHLSQLRFTFFVTNMTHPQVINYPISDSINVTSGSNIIFPKDLKITVKTLHSLAILILPTDKSFSYFSKVSPFDRSNYRYHGPLQLRGSSLFDFMENFGEGIHSIKGIAYPVFSHSPFGGYITDQQGHRSYVDYNNYQHRLLFDITFSIKVNR
jgi:hypothetical protein